MCLLVFSLFVLFVFRMSNIQIIIINFFSFRIGSIFRRVIILIVSFFIEFFGLNNFLIWLYKLTGLVVLFSCSFFVLAFRSLTFSHDVSNVTINVVLDDHFLPLILDFVVSYQRFSTFSLLKCIFVFSVAIEFFVRFKVILSDPNFGFGLLVFFIVMLVVGFAFEFGIYVINWAFMIGSMTSANLAHATMVMLAHKRRRGWFF